MDKASEQNSAAILSAIYNCRFSSSSRERNQNVLRLIGLLLYALRMSLQTTLYSGSANSLSPIRASA